MITEQMVEAAEKARQNYYQHCAGNGTVQQAMRVALTAALSGSPQVEAGTVEAGPWNALASFGFERKRHWLLIFEDADEDVMRFDDEGQAHRSYEQYSDSWNCTLYEVAKRKVLTRPREQEGGEAPVAWRMEFFLDGCWETWFGKKRPDVYGWTGPTRNMTPLYAHPALPAGGWKEGAEAMRERAAHGAWVQSKQGATHEQIAEYVRAMPLPTPASAGEP